MTPDGEVVLRSNVSADVLRSFGEDLKNVADELTHRRSRATRHTNQDRDRAKGSRHVGTFLISEKPESTARNFLRIRFISERTFV